MPIVIDTLKELLDNISQANDFSEGYREILSDQLNIYHTTISSKLNDVMKFLALISATMLPLTLLSGIYGMNFDHMPLMHSENGYLITIGLMVLIFTALIAYFWRKGWF